MAPKKSSLKSLSKKGVSTSKASQVKGGAAQQGPRTGKLAANHSQTQRKVKNLAKKAVSQKKAAAVKGGASNKGTRNDRLAANHNQTVRAR